MIPMRAEIDKRLARIDFNELYVGFTAYDYALYDDKHVYLKDRVIEKDQRFIGNTAIQFDDAYLAIWYKPDGDLDVLTANIIHEMFHCFQLDTKVKIMIDDVNAMKFKLDEAYLQLKHAEKECLVKAIKEDDKEAYGHVLSIRNKRQSLNPIYAYEMALETFEGIAECCKLKALSILNDRAYLKEIEKGTTFILEEHFDTRRITYYTGGYMQLLAQRFNDVTIDDFEIDTLRDFTDEIKAYEESITKAFDTLKVTEQVSGRICGYDPMNMVGRKNEILHKHMVMIYIDGQSVFYQGPVVTVYDEDAFQVLEIRK